MPGGVYLAVDIDILKTQVQSVRGKIGELAKEQDFDDPSMQETSNKLENLLADYETLLTRIEQ